jgi:putative alpha-1,2-mannosidase
MAKAVADTNSGSNQGGFTWDDSKVTGFSSMHDSGTGGEPSLGNFALFPYAQCPGDDLTRCAFPKKNRATNYIMDSVTAQPGYFGLKLGSGVQVTMTATHHVSLFKFTFPDFKSNAGKPLILMDLTDLSDSRQDNGTVTVDPKTGRIMGGGRFKPSFGVGAYDAYFCADFNGGTIADTGIFVNNRPTTEVQELVISRSINGYPLPGGGFVRFSGLDSTSSVLARVGISLKSAERACENSEREIPDWNFDTVKIASQDVWRNKLKWVQVSEEGVNSTYKTMLYR